ncbi:MAG: TRAP transporter TatT component family protein, partial [Vicinamibacteria bacterium]|nr:TRAP transporter TatT component family protein [Vicinamibacteria bacterium]
TIEALLDETPRHKDLLLAAASGFAQYAYGFVQQEADFIEARDLSRATDLRARAKRLYLRGRDYGWRGLEVSLPGFRAELRKDRTTALTRARKAHVPLLYWTALAWFGAINLAKNEAELTADQDLAEALMRRALALDEAYERGVIHDFFIAWEARGPSVGGSFTRAKTHLDRALALSQGRRARPLVAYAEAAAVGEQNRQSFEETLARALAVDPEADPEQRLVNVLIQKRARWLRGRADELFIE